MNAYFHQRRAREPDNIDLAVAANIRKLRRAAGMSQGMLGQRIGVTYQQVQKYETGTDRICASRLWRCANALNVPLAMLFEGVPSELP